jgi:hypothetical protein
MPGGSGGVAGGSGTVCISSGWIGVMTGLRSVATQAQGNRRSSPVDPSRRREQLQVH